MAVAVAMATNANANVNVNVAAAISSESVGDRAASSVLIHPIPTSTF